MSTLDTDAIAARLKNATDYTGAIGDRVDFKAALMHAEFHAYAPGDIGALLAEVATLRALLNRAEPLIRDEWDGTRPESEGNVWLADYVRVSRLTEEPQQ